MVEDRTTDLLQFATNDPVLFDLVRAVTGCGPIGNFRGRLFRMAPGGAHHDGWHADLTGGRMIAMSLNLAREPFQGGRLHLRRCPSGELLDVVENPRFGDAVVFRLREDLEHRIGDMEGKTPRTTYAGWFRSHPDFRDQLFMGLGRGPSPTG